LTRTGTSLRSRGQDGTDCEDVRTLCHSCTRCVPLIDECAGISKGRPPQEDGRNVAALQEFAIAQGRWTKSAECSDRVAR